MKKLLFMLLSLLLCGMAQAQENVEITLNNGDVVKGVTKTLFMFDDGDVIVAKASKSEEKKEYKSAHTELAVAASSEASRVVFPPLELLYLSVNEFE